MLPTFGPSILLPPLNNPGHALGNGDEKLHGKTAISDLGLLRGAVQYELRSRRDVVMFQHGALLLPVDDAHDDREHTATVGDEAGQRVTRPQSRGRVGRHEDTLIRVGEAQQRGGVVHGTRLDDHRRR